MDKEANLLTMSKGLEHWVGCLSQIMPQHPNLLREVVYEADLERFDAYMNRLYSGQMSSLDPVAKKVLFLSDAIFKITGYSPEQAKEPDFWLRIAHKEENPQIQEIITTVGQGIASLSEYRIIHASGELRWLQIRVIPTLDESQSVVRLDGT